MPKEQEIKFDVPDFSGFTEAEVANQMSVDFDEVYKLKNVVSTAPSYVPKNEFDCYVRYVNGADYKLYVYLGETVGWKSVVLS